MFRSNVPAANLPDGWHSKQLKEIARVYGGGRLGLNKSDYVDQGIPAYSAAGQDGYVDVAEGEEPSIILSSIGARCGKSFLAEGRWTTLANTQVITPEPEVADASYLIGLLDNEDYWNRSGSAQPFIKPSDVKGAWVPLPPLDEQRRIAEVLRSVDEAIAAADAVARQWETASSSFLDAAFTEGEPTGLDDLCSLIYRYPGFYGFDQLEEGVPVIRGEHLRAGRISTDWADFYFVDPEFSARFPKTILQPDDVVMSVRGTVGTTAVVEASHVGSQISPNLIRLVANPAKIMPPLLYYAVQSAVAHMRRTIVNAQALPAINAGDLKRVEIALPPVPEQTELLAQLNGAAEATAQAIAAVRQARETKASLMTDLLSGRVRVPA